MNIKKIIRDDEKNKYSYFFTILIQKILLYELSYNNYNTITLSQINFTFEREVNDMIIEIRGIQSALITINSILITI